MNEHAFFARVNESLDARRDPLDDGELVAFLAAHPEHLDAFAALRADLRTLGTTPRIAVRRRRWPFVAAAAAAAAAIAIAIVWPNSPRARAPRILAASLEELPPRAHIAASYCVRESLLATSTTCFETLDHRSEPRW